jgi:hypothetical protein
MSVQGSNELALRIPRYLTMSERPVYTELITGYQIEIRRGARSVEMRNDFIKQNANFEKSQELKGQS